MPSPELSTNKLVIRKLIPATREEVFAAWTDAESMKHWMCPGDNLTAEATLDVRVGGAFRIMMRKPGQDCEHTGEYQVVEPPSKLVFTWISRFTENQPSLVTVELFDRGGQCELVLIHDRLPHAEAVKQHSGGWTSIAERLAEYMAGKKNDFRMKLTFNAPAGKLYEQFATQQGVRNWWTNFCDMEEKVGGKASFRFPKSDFYAITRISRLEPERCVEWECLDSKHPDKLQFSDPRDWIGTKLRFEVAALNEGQSQLTFTHAGLAPLECVGVCTNAWSFFLNDSLRNYLETGVGKAAKE